MLDEYLQWDALGCGLVEMLSASRAIPASPFAATSRPRGASRNAGHLMPFMDALQEEYP
jgi:hypothetical protein